MSVRGFVSDSSDDCEAEGVTVSAVATMAGMMGAVVRSITADIGVCSLWHLVKFVV